MDHARRRSGGFTLGEMMTVVAIIGLASALALPSMERWQTNQRLNTAGRELAGLLAEGRGLAAQTGRVHLVFMQTNASGVALVDANGDSVEALLVDDGAPGTANQNCSIDAGEIVGSVSAVSGVAWGVSLAAAASPQDVGVGDYRIGASFAEPGGSDATWVMFREQGFPLAFDSACTLGAVGSGAGAAYLTSGTRDLVVHLSPLGSSKVVRWDENGSRWGS